MVELLVDGRQLFVGALQLFLGGLQLFIGALQLFVAGEDLLVGRAQLLVDRVLLLEKRLQVVLGGGKLLADTGQLFRPDRPAILSDFRAARVAVRSQPRAGRGRQLVGEKVRLGRAFAVVEQDEEARIRASRQGDRND